MRGLEMLHLALMGFGFLMGASLGGANWLWGLGFGFLLGEFVRTRQSLGRLERELKGLRRPEAPGRPAPAPAAPAAPAEPEPVAAPAPVPQPPPAAPSPAEWLAAARETEPRPAEPIVQRAAPDDWLTRGARRVWGFVSGGNPLVRVGALVLLVGVAFLLKYLSERVTVPIEWRLAGVAAGGIALVLLGIRLRWKRPDFALPVQGAGLGVLFLTLFAGFRLYQVLPSGVAFALMLAVVAATIALALWQDALVLAAFGVGGGFLAPLLTSTGQGSHVELFTYYLILNAVVLGVAWFRAWRMLNWLGFVFTFGVGLFWGARYYRPEYFATIEPFLLAHVGLYILVAVLFAARQPPRLKGLVDATIVFGTPLIGFALQAELLRDSEYGLAWSALALGLTYLLLAAAMWWRDRRHFALLCQCFLALGIGFVTLAVPLAFDARVTSALWCVEGAAIVWVALRQQRMLARLSGYALMLLGSLAYLLEGGRAAASTPFLNADFVGSALVAVAFGFVAYLRRGSGDWLGARGAWLYGLAWWLGGGGYEIYWQLDAAGLTERGLWQHWVLVWTCLSLGTGCAATRRLAWPDWRWAGVIQSGVPALFLLALAEVDSAIFPGWRWAAWLLAGAVQYAMLYLDRSAADRTLAARHGAGLVTAAAVLAYGLWHWAKTRWGLDHALTVSLPALAPAALAALSGWRASAARWPVRDHALTYRVYALIPVWVWLLLWLQWVNVSPPPAFGLLGFRPLVNMLDLTCLAVLVLLSRQWPGAVRGQRADVVAMVHALLGLFWFLWLNAALLRALSFLLEIPYRWEPMWDSISVQAAVTLLWVVCALGLMVAGARLLRRWVWIAGALLMGLAVLKLFAVDTAGSGTVARIVAFFGVAAALLLAGYLVPRPPGAAEIVEPARKSAPNGP